MDGKISQLLQYLGLGDEHGHETSESGLVPAETMAAMMRGKPAQMTEMLPARSVNDLRPAERQQLLYGLQENDQSIPPELTAAFDRDQQMIPRSMSGDAMLQKAAPRRRVAGPSPAAKAALERLKLRLALERAAEAGEE